MPGAYGTFEGFAFHPDFGTEAVAGTIYFSMLSLTFRSGEMVLEIPLRQLSVRVEESAERVIFHDSNQPELVITTCDLSVLELTSIPQLAQLSEQVTGKLVRRELGRRIKIAVGFCAGCALVFWLGMLAIGVMVRSIVARVPAEVERQHGEAVIKELGLDFATHTNEALQLTAIAEPLLKAVPGGQKWEFHVAEIDMPNAFALPGGHIVVTTGMLAFVEKPEELLGVVAHEMAHVIRKHNLRMQIAAAGPLLVLDVFLRGRSGTMGVMAGGSALLVAQSFSQEYEKEADEVGWDYLVAANIDPRGMIESFRKLKEWEAKSNERDVLPKAFRSHPDLDKRIARLESKWRRLRTKSGFRELDPLPELLP